MATTVHPSAIVDAGERVGAHCSFWQNVFVANDVPIGGNVKIQNNLLVYDAVMLGDDVFCGPSMVFTNVYNLRSAVTSKDEYRHTLIRRGDKPRFARFALMNAHFRCAGSPP